MPIKEPYFFQYDVIFSSLLIGAYSRYKFRDTGERIVREINPVIIISHGKYQAVFICCVFTSYQVLDQWFQYIRLRTTILLLGRLSLEFPILPLHF